MEIEAQQKRSKTRLGIVLLILTTVLLSTIGGGLLGGIAGYAIALNQRPEALANQSLTNITVPASDELTSIVPTLSSVSENSAAVVTENEALIEAVERVKLATVTVLNANGQGVGSGSGVIIDPAGYILTNQHVIEGANQVEVIFSHGGDVPAQIVGSSSEFDLAILKVDASYVPAVAVLGDSSALRPGERVAAIGSALGGFRNTVTSGVLSAHNRTFPGKRHGLLQTDAAINHGNSGGPLINLQGEVIGINVMVLRGNFGGDIPEGLGFSIPSNTAKMVAKQLIEKGTVEVPFLGVSPEDLNPQLSMENNLSVVTGSLITEVVRGSPAAAAGLQPGDVIMAVNQQLVDDAHPLSQLLLQQEVGNSVQLTIVRGQDQFDISVTLTQDSSR
jgi:2-alkenal reductase